MKSAGQSRENTPPPVGAGGGARRRRDGRGKKAPLADQGWCSAQRIRIWMVAGGNHTIIHAVMAVSRKAMTEGIRTPMFPSTYNKCSCTIPQSRACVRRASQLPLHKGAFGCSRTPSGGSRRGCAWGDQPMGLGEESIGET